MQWRSLIGGGVLCGAMLVQLNIVSAPPPLRFTIDCGSEEKGSSYRKIFKSKSAENSHSRFNVDSFCNLIHNAIPKAVKDGKFILLEEPDQSGFSNNQIPVSVPVPKRFIPKLGFPKFRTPQVRIPKFNVPTLRAYDRGLTAPRVGSPMSFSSFRESVEEETSVEKMEKFKKGVQKMLHVVKVLGQIDQYLSERIRIIVDKLSRTFSD